MRGFKGFDYELKCTPGSRSKQYAIGKTFRLCKREFLKMCTRGIHFCEKLWDVLTYYPPFNPGTGERNRYAEIITGWHGRSLKPRGNSMPGKRCAGDIEIRNELRLEDLWSRRTNGWVKEYVPVATEPGVARNSGPAVTTVRNSVAISERNSAVAFGSNSAAFGNDAAVTFYPCSLAEGNMFAMSTGYASLAKAKGVEGVALSASFAEVTEPTGIAITRLFARGVRGSRLIFIHGSGAIGVAKVDGDRVREHVWYQWEPEDNCPIPVYEKDRV